MMLDWRKIDWKLLSLMVLTLLLFFFRLGERSFRNPDEGRYAHAAYDMVISGNWLEPRIYGVDYLRKPVLFYWLVAASFSLFGFTELAARLVPALFGAAGVWTTYWFTKKFFDEKTAFYAALVLVSNFWYLQVGRYLLIDMLFSYLIVTGLFCFYAAWMGSAHKRLLYVSAYLCFCLAFLSKGVVGILLPALIIVCYMAWIRQLKKILSPQHLLLALMVFVLTALPWYVLIAIKEPEFLKFFFFHEHLSRFTSAQFEHQEGWYYYLLATPVLFVPWVLFYKPWAILFQSVKENNKKNEIYFSGIAVICILVFYSLSRTKLLTYMVPVIPFISILIGYGWRRWEETDKAFKFGPLLYWALIPLFFMGILVVIGTESFLGHFMHKYDTKLIADIQWIAGAVAAGSFIALRAVRAKNLNKVFFAMVLMMVSVSFVVNFAMENINHSYTTKIFAYTLKPIIKDKDPVYIYGNPGAFYDFEFYLRHPVKLVGLEGELKLSGEYEEAYETHDSEERQSWITKDEFLDLIKKKTPLYCLMRRSDYEALTSRVGYSFKILEEDARKILFQSGPTI